MLSRLIITFLCAAAIGSVSGAFLTFDPDPIVLKDADISTSVSVQLKSKPAEAVTVYFESPSTFMSTCVIVFDPNSWNVPQKINVMSVPPPIDPSDPRKQAATNSELLAKAVAVGPLSADLSSTDVLKITQASKDLSHCRIGDNIVNIFDSLDLLFSKPGWYQMVSTGDIEVQILWSECGAGLKCFPAVVFRYGPTVMSLDTRGPVKGIGEYPMTEVTPNTSGVRYTSGSEPGLHTIVFPCGSKLNIVVINKNGIINLFVFLYLVAGYTSPRGFCNKPRPDSPDNKLIGSDGKLYSHERENEVDAFFRSWGIKDENVLTNPDTRASIPPLQQPGTICKFPKDPPPKPVDPVPTTTTGTTTAATTAATTTTATTTAATTAATTTAATTSSTTSTTATALYSASTLPSTTSTTTSSTSTIYPLPPTPSGYIPPPPPPPDVVVEIQKCCQSIFNIPSCNTIVPAESYIQSCILDAQASGSYVLSDKVKQAYLAKCRTLTDDMILDPTKEVIDQGNQIRKEYGFGNVTCINSCSGKGTCTDFGCACSPGFSGMDCSMDLTKANQYDPTVDQYRINVNITVIQEQMEQHSKLPGSVPYATPASSDPSDPSVDQSLASFVGSLPKPSTVSPHIAEESQSPSPDSYDDFQKPIISSAISLGSLRMVSIAAVVITSQTNDSLTTALVCSDGDSTNMWRLCLAPKLLSTSIAHLVVECEQVTSHRIQSGLVPAIQKSRLRLLGRALDPGVENVYTWLRGGVLNGEADLDQRWLDGTVEHESMGTRHDNRALAARLADFLQVAYRQYQSTLWKYHRDRLVEVG
ncbi:hypothetical protein BASA83_013186 [Batrachochytrium salamandrivorans]|nr:hypothetical protein BASA83_013186 [Batrachochytrium salamandrivorans]